MPESYPNGRPLTQVLEFVKWHDVGPLRWASIGNRVAIDTKMVTKYDAASCLVFSTEDWHTDYWIEKEFAEEYLKDAI